MTFTRVLAQSAVADLERSIDWYSALFGRQPDARPMPGLVEWHLGHSHGVQVWVDTARAGHSSMVMDESDFDGLIARLDQSGLDHDQPEKVTASRILVLADPDGNRIVISGAFAEE